MNLEPLRDALAKATATPWKITGVMSGHAGDLYAATAQRIPDCHHIARFYAPKPEKAPSCSLAAMGAAREAISQIEANATLTALAVNALPDLLAEIARQREVIEAWHAIDRKRDAEIERLREANGILEDALQEVGDDYPGSSCQEWCQQQVKQARAALKEPSHED